MTLRAGFAVVIPTKNRAAIAEAKARWVLSQADVDQLIVVVDGSTDDTLNCLRKIDDSRLEIIVHPISLGAPRAKNVGLERSSTEWVVTLDDDDKHSDHFMTDLRDVAIAHEVDVIAAPWFNFTSGIEPSVGFANAERAATGPLPGRPDAVPVGAFVETVWAHANFVVSRRVIDAGIRYDERFRYNFWREETDFLISAARAGFRVGASGLAYSYMTERAAGGIARRSLLYELWTVLNDVRLMAKHGRWLAANHYLTSPYTFVVRNAILRVGMRLRPAVRRLCSRTPSRP